MVAPATSSCSVPVPNWPYCGSRCRRISRHRDTFGEASPVCLSPRIALVAARSDPPGAQRAERQGWRAGTSATRSQTIERGHPAVTRMGTANAAPRPETSAASRLIGPATRNPHRQRATLSHLPEPIETTHSAAIANYRSSHVVSQPVDFRDNGISTSTTNVRRNDLLELFDI